MTTAVAVDLDGTVYQETTPIPGAAAAIQRLLSAGHRVVYVTNDATLTCAQRAARLTAMGFPAVSADVITAGAAAARYVGQLGTSVSQVMVVGPPAIAAELRHECPGLEIAEPVPGQRADAVVVGLDRRLSLERLGAAHTAIRAGAHFIATNADPAYPTAEGGTAPGAGAIVAALERSTATRAVTVGKPDPSVFRLAAERLGVGAAALIVVGDSHSDLQAAAACGATSVLVLSGVTRPGDERDSGAALVLPSIAALPGHIDRLGALTAGGPSGYRPATTDPAKEMAIDHTR